MESRFDLYDPRNTVALRPAGKRNQERRRQAIDPNHPRENPNKLMEFDRKVAMVQVCRFCNRNQGEDGTRAICRFCHCCQYCGLVPAGSHACEFCGNRDLDRSAPKPKRIRRAEGDSKPSKKPRRNVRRIGPQRRSRNARTTNPETL